MSCEWYDNGGTAYFYDDFSTQQINPWLGYALDLYTGPTNTYEHRRIKMPVKVSYNGNFSATYKNGVYTFNIANITLNRDRSENGYWGFAMDIETVSGKHSIANYHPREHERIGYTGYGLVAGKTQTGTISDYYDGIYKAYSFIVPAINYYSYNNIARSEQGALTGTVTVKDNGPERIKKITFYLTQSPYANYSGGYNGTTTYVQYAVMGVITSGFKITFNTNGGTMTIPSQTAESITLPNPGTRAGYTFDGWYNGDTRIGGIGDKWKPTADATITAKWTPIIYTIRYNTYEGNLSKEKTVTYTVESPTITLENPTLDGKEFLGWSDWNDGTPKKPYTIPKGTVGDLIISANWGADTSGYGDYMFTGQSHVKSNKFKIAV